MECVGFSVEESDYHVDPSEPAHIITAQMVRTLPIGQFIERARRAEAGASEIVFGLYHEEGLYAEAHDAWEDGRRFKAKAGGRPRMYGGEHYRDVARVYAAAWRKGDPPTKAVEKHFQVSHSTAARWVRECRKPKRGFLGETQKRRAGGVLPPEQEEGT